MGTAGWTSPTQIADQIAINRASSNVFGQVHFRHAFLATNPLNYRTDLKDNIYNKPALLPAMPWKDDVRPETPAAVNAALNEDGSVSLSWARPADGLGELDKVRRYAVYRSEQRDIDIENADNLIGITNTDETAYTDHTVEAGKFYYYSVTALNRLHHESLATNTVSNDTEAPVVKTQNISRSLLGGTVSITTADVDNGSTDNWGIDSLSLNKTEFSCSNIGDNQVVLSATDKAGNIASAPAVVTVLGVIPSPTIEVTGLAANAITLGYGPQAATLTATDSAPSSTSNFAWTPGEGLSATNGASVQFVPTATGTFAFKVRAVNQNGCSAESTVSIPVVDARCEKNKVMLCKTTGSSSNPGNQLCVSENAVPAHLRNGATLGACG